MPAPDAPPSTPGTAPVDPSRIPRPPRAALGTRRDAVIARLQDSVSAGHLELDELDERLALAMRAHNDAELDVLVADLPPLRGIAASVPALVSPAAMHDSAPTAERLTAVFSGIDKKGRRTLPRQIRARAFFGGITLDLREATFRPGLTVIRCLSCFGGVDITVPPHVRVEVAGSGIFGGFDGDESDGDAAVQDARGADEDAPVLRVEGTAIFGGVSVRRKDTGLTRGDGTLPRRLG